MIVSQIYLIRPPILKLEPAALLLAPLNSVGKIMCTRQVTRATHVRNRICPRVEVKKNIVPCMGFELGSLHSQRVTS